jgi:hypothetical protein
MSRAFVPLGISSALLIGVLATLAALLSPAVELTRFRNSLIAFVGTDSDFTWVPETLPAEFKNETATPPSIFIAAADAAVSGPNAVSIVEALVAHLRTKPKTQGPIKSTTLTAYREILATGRGYCADYTQVFNGLAYSARLPVREWGMSFDRYGGDGHAFSEVYDFNERQWIFVDPMNGFYVRDSASGRPLSVLEFRDRLSSRQWESLTIAPIADDFLFASAEEAFAYYEQGTDQFFLWFGNAVFSYDGHPVVQALGWSRALEQLATITLGVHPTIRLLPTPTNEEEIRQLFQLRYYVFGLMVAATVLCAAVVFQALRIFKVSRKSA